MKALLFLASEEAAKSTFYNIGYALGYFVGTVEKHPYVSVLVAALLIALVVFFILRNTKMKKTESNFS